MAVIRTRRVRESAFDRRFQVVNYSLLAVFTLLVLYPLVFVASASVSSGEALASGKVVLWPVGFNVDAYGVVLSSPRLVRSILNSLVYTVTGALLATSLTVLAGYVLSRETIPFRRVLTFFFLLPALVSGGIIPTYLVVRQLGLLNTPLAVIIPGAVNVFLVIITRTFYQMSIPRELLDSGQVDGASDFRFFWSIGLPLSKPIIAVLLLFYGVAQWNGWFNAFLYLNNADLYPVQLVLREILTQNQIDPSQMGNMDLTELRLKKELFDKLKYALIVIAMVPPLVAYPFVQKHFVKGVLIGSVK